MSDWDASTSTILPLPSSPHWHPTMTVTATDDVSLGVGDGALCGLRAVRWNWWALGGSGSFRAKLCPGGVDRPPGRRMDYSAGGTGLGLRPRGGFTGAW